MVPLADEPAVLVAQEPRLAALTRIFSSELWFVPTAAALALMVGMFMYFGVHCKKSIPRQKSAIIAEARPLPTPRAGPSRRSKARPSQAIVLPRRSVPSQHRPSVPAALLQPETPGAASWEPALNLVVTRPPDFSLASTLGRRAFGWGTAVAFSADGQRMASASWNQALRLWDVFTGRDLGPVADNAKAVQAIAFSRDGYWLATEDSSNTVTVWDAGANGREKWTARGRQGLAKNWVYSIAFSPDGRLLAAAFDDKTVRLWDVATGERVRDLSGRHRLAIYVAFSPNGRWLASGFDDKSIDVWDVSTGQEVRRLSGHKKTVYAAVFSPNGQWLASASADGTAMLWDPATGRSVHVFAGHGDAVTSLAFSDDGRWLASGSWDKTIKIWDVATGRELQTLLGNEHPVYAVVFDSDARWLVSGCEDGTTKLWHLKDDFR